MAFSGAFAAAVGIMFVTAWVVARPHYQKAAWLKFAVLIGNAFCVGILFLCSSISRASVGCCGGVLLASDAFKMNWLLLYLVLLKATITSFSGLASLPIVCDELVVHRHLLTTINSICPSSPVVRPARSVFTW